LVAKYREHHKKHGRDPDDPDSGRPSEKEDVALMKQLFPEGVPEKTLRAMRKGVWGKKIKRGRRPKFR
jgi:hypothetical protein